MSEKATKKPRRQVTDVRRWKLVRDAKQSTGTPGTATVDEFIRTLEISALEEMADS